MTDEIPEKPKHIPQPRVVISQEIIDKVAGSLYAGNYFNTACWYAGISDRTGHQWKARGEKAEENDPDNPEEQLFIEFYREVNIASAEAETAKLARLDLAGAGKKIEGRRGTWQADAWWLERRFPNKWGRRTEVEETKRLDVTIHYQKPGETEAE